MDEDSIYVLVLLAMLDESLQFRPIGRFGRFSLIYKVADNSPSLSFGILLHRLYLGRNRKLFLGLFVRGDTGIKKTIHRMCQLINDESAIGLDSLILPIGKLVVKKA